MFLTWIWLIDCLIIGADLSLFLAFASVSYQVVFNKSAAGLSLQTLFIVVFTRVFHLLSHPLDLHFEPTMVPSWIYGFFDVLTSTFGVLIIYYVFSKLLHSYDSDLDTFGDVVGKWIVPGSFGVLGKLLSRITVSLCFSIALGFVWWLIRRSHQAFISSYFACFYEVLGAVALFPQLWMFQKTRVASAQLANFVAMIALNRICTLLFWIVYPWIFHWRYPDNRGIQMASEVINLLIISDFLYYYVRAKLRGDSEVRIPLTEGGV
jgi:ER lumen protein retaining receptor